MKKITKPKQKEEAVYYSDFSGKCFGEYAPPVRLKLEFGYGSIYDGSRFTSDMAIQNVIGDSFRGATWVSIHNGGGVGWGEVINGGFGLLLDGSARADQNVTSMLHWDVNNGIARRNWARNPNAIYAIERAMKMEPKLKVTLPNLVDSDVLKGLF